ncbi:MAG: hypothetical protein LC115_11885 [Bacteroidia bacterium]|nr:hypothetical protein [Bacteroidia bacterium]
MTFRTTYYFIGIFIGLFVACTPPEKPADTPLPTPTQNAVFIINEGNFGWGNASISYYDSTQKTTTKDIFQPANNRPIGDVLQDAKKIGNYLWTVVNNSGKIEIIDTKTFKSVYTISGLKSPRYLLPIHSKAYLSDFKDNAISVLDLNEKKITQKIYFPGWSEQMLLYQNIIWITAPHSKNIYLLDTLTNTIQDSILLNTGGTSIVMDKLNRIWVLCEGDIGGIENPILYVINPETKQIIQKFVFGKSASSRPRCLATSNDKSYIYFFNKHLYRLGIMDTTLPAQYLIQNTGGEWYSLNIQPNTNNLFITNAMDYVQIGKLETYSPEGNLIGSIPAGIVPNGVIF